jgi:hypothetical protein
VNVIAAGDDKEYLLYVATPENEDALQGMAKEISSNPSARANFCLHGFAEVQFIIRDENMNQTLAGKFQTNFDQTLDYVRERQDATPIR